MPKKKDAAHTLTPEEKRVARANALGELPPSKREKVRSAEVADNANPDGTVHVTRLEINYKYGEKPPGYVEKEKKR